MISVKLQMMSIWQSPTASSSADTLVLNGTTNKGVFKTGDPVYVQLTNGKVVEGTISRMEQLRQDVTESTLGESIGIMVDGLSISDQDYVTGGVIVVK